MDQVVIQHFELERVPQAVPRATEYPIDELPPQLTESRFNPLPHLTEQEFVGRDLVASNQQHLSLLGHASGKLCTPVAQVPHQYAAVHVLEQGQRWCPIIPIPGGQAEVEHPPANMAQHVQLEAKEPPLTGFAKVRPLVAQQPHAPMADALAEGNRLAVDQVQPRCTGRRPTGEGQQAADVGPELMHARQPLLVGGQVGKGRAPVVGHQPIGLLERGHFQNPLQQGNRQHFGIAESRLGVGRATPARPGGMGFEELIDEVVDLGHVVVYAVHHKVVVLQRESQRLHFDSTPPGGIDDLTASTQD